MTFRLERGIIYTSYKRRISNVLERNDIMTAIQNQITKVYIANFTNCSSKSGFFRTLARTFGINANILGKSDNAFWHELCKRTAVIAALPYPVRIKTVGLSAVDKFYPEGVYFLLRVFNAMEDTGEDLRANAS